MTEKYTEFADQGDILNHDDPFEIFNEWYNLASEHEINDPNACNLATIDQDNRPDARIVLLKEYNQRNFYFYTNQLSSKGRQISFNPYGAMCFHWKSIRRQIRIRGEINFTDENKTKAYFDSRSKGSRLSALASKQSERMKDKNEFISKLKSLEKEYENKDVTKPDYWRGYFLIADEIEFWVNRPYRAHDRKKFIFKNGKWEYFYLYP